MANIIVLTESFPFLNQTGITTASSNIKKSIYVSNLEEHDCPADDSMLADTVG